MPAAEQHRQLTSFVRSIILSFEQNVFVRDATAGGLEEFVHRSQQGGDADLYVDRNQAVPQLIVRGMQ